MDRLNEGKQILQEISVQKRKLVEVATEKGLHSAETILCSQELDELINAFYRCIRTGYELQNSR